MDETIRLRPSSAARRVACPGSYALEKSISSESTNASREGETAHWIAHMLLENPLLLENPQTKFKIGEIAENGEIITSEMMEGADLYINDVFNIQKHKSSSDLMVEKFIEIKRIHPNCAGTPDCWFIRDDGKLFIWDYKFGHKHVEVFENWQLIEYAAGILDFIGMKGWEDQHIEVHFRIVQPRSYHREGPIREWVIKASDLRPYFNTLEAAEDLATQPDALCKPSLECTNCKARFKCEALQQTSLAMAATINAENLPLDIPSVFLGSQLKFLQYANKLIETYIDALSAECIARLKKGEKIPYFRLEESYGREKWKKPIEEIIAMGEMMGIDLKKSLDAITPKQAIKAGLDEKLVRTYSETLKGELKLVPIDSKSIRKIFS